MYKYLLAAVLVVAAPSIASAGGGNSKSNGTIRVQNTSSTQVLLVAVNPSSSLLTSTTLSQFTSRGGKVVNPGGRVDFTNVKVGSQQLVYALVNSDATSVTASDFTTRNVNVTKGKTTTINLQ